MTKVVQSIILALGILITSKIYLLEKSLQKISGVRDLVHLMHQAWAGWVTTHDYRLAYIVRTCYMETKTSRNRMLILKRGEGNNNLCKKRARGFCVHVFLVIFDALNNILCIKTCIFSTFKEKVESHLKSLSIQHHVNYSWFQL